MSIHVPGFLSYFTFFFASFRIGKISHQQYKGYQYLKANLFQIAYCTKYSFAKVGNECNCTNFRKEIFKYKFE